MNRIRSLEVKPKLYLCFHGDSFTGLIYTGKYLPSQEFKFFPVIFPFKINMTFNKG